MADSKTGHAQYSPSSLELLELCPCFEQDNSGENLAAKDGTRLHRAAETRDLSLCQDEDEENAVQRCIDYEDNVLDNRTEDCVVQREVSLLIEDMTKGIGDVVMVDGSDAELIDWKFGYTPVTPAKDNVQMQGYVLGVFTMYPDVDNVTVHIVGPRIDYLSTHKYNRLDCDAIRDRIQRIIQSCEAEDKTETPSEKGCKYCGRKAECKALNSVALTVGRGLGLPMPSEFEAGKLILPEDRARAQVLSYILEDWAKKVRELNAKAAVEDGIEIPGFEIRSKRGRRTVVDVFTAVKRILENYDDVSSDDIYQACSLSVTQLVNEIYAKSQLAERKETKKAIREQVDELFKDLVSESEAITFLQRRKGKSNEEIIEELGQ